MPSRARFPVETVSLDDTALIAQWQSGDSRAGARLLDRHSHAVVGFFKRKARADAEDLTHATFVRMLENRDRVRDARAFRAYVLGIARNVLREHLREVARERNAHALVDSIPQLAPAPSTVTSKNEERRLLLEGLLRLPTDDQPLVELFYWEELDSGGVGKLVGMPASSIRTRLSRARERLRQIMTEIRISHAIPAPSMTSSHGRLVFARACATTSSRRTKQDAADETNSDIGQISWDSCGVSFT